MFSDLIRPKIKLLLQLLQQIYNQTYKIHKKDSKHLK